MGDYALKACKLFSCRNVSCSRSIHHKLIFQKNVSNCAPMGHYVLEACKLFSLGNVFYARKDTVIISGTVDSMLVAIFPVIGSLHFRTF